jgi:hypothetical protein
MKQKPFQNRRLVIRQGRCEQLAVWWAAGKLHGSEELGDLMASAGDRETALKVYNASGARGKARRF